MKFPQQPIWFRLKPRDPIPARPHLRSPSLLGVVELIATVCFKRRSNQLVPNWPFRLCTRPGWTAQRLARATALGDIGDRTCLDVKVTKIEVNRFEWQMKAIGPGEQSTALTYQPGASMRRSQYMTRVFTNSGVIDEYPFHTDVTPMGETCWARTFWPSNGYTRT